MAAPIIDHNLLTLDYWQDSVTYEGKTVPGGTIGCEALNIPDTLREKLAQASIPLQKIVAPFYVIVASKIVADGVLRGVARDLCRRGCAIAENEILKHKVAQHHDDLAADGAQQREAKGLFAAGAEDQRRDHGRTPFDDERAGRVAHVAGDHIRQTGAETGSHAAVERASQQGGEYDHDVAGVEIAAGHGRDLDDERRHAAQRHEHGGVDEISEFLVHNYHLFMLLAQEYDIRHK